MRTDRVTDRQQTGNTEANTMARPLYLFITIVIIGGRANDEIIKRLRKCWV
jgi:hypothetical protein